jgi:hypothetical protein
MFGNLPGAKLSEGEALKAGMEQKAREFKQSGAEVYAKA